MNVDISAVLNICEGKEFIKPFGVELLPKDYTEIKFETHEFMLRFFVINEALFHSYQVRTKAIGLSLICWKRG